MKPGNLLYPQSLLRPCIGGVKNWNATQLEHIDKDFKNISERDFEVTGEELKTTVASVTTREILAVKTVNNDSFMTVDIPDAYRIDAKPFIERPFYVTEVKFPDTAGRYTLLNTSVKFLPGDVIRSNLSLVNAMRMAAYYRSDLVLNFSIAGTITHAGCIVVGVLPPMQTYPSIFAGAGDLLNTILTGPHAFLNANEATSVTIPVPWYCNADMATLDMQNEDPTLTTLDLTSTNGNYATLVFYVLNPLAPSSGSSKTLSIIVEACFKHLDIVVPTPRFISFSPQSGIIDAVGGALGGLGTGLLDFAAKGLKTVAGDAIDAGRGLVKEYTGLHNPNYAVISARVIETERNFHNTVDSQQLFEKLDPYSEYDRIVREPIFGTAVDEMALSHIGAKKQYLGTFKVDVDMQVGKLLWARPISPFQGGVRSNTAGDGRVCINNIELVHSLSRGWRGGIKLHIQSAMNNKQQTKLKVFKLYNPSVAISTGYPVYQTIANAPSHLLEYTAGGQTHQVDLPYLCRNAITPCAEDMSFEALFHGEYYIYLAQPLANSDGSPLSVEFNVYMSLCDDFTWYGYANKTVTSSPLFNPESGSMQVMNQPQKQNDPIVGMSIPTEIHTSRLRPNVDVRPYIRRMYRIDTDSMDLDSFGEDVRAIDLASVIAENSAVYYDSPIDIISRMYYGKTVGFKFRVTITSIDYEPNIQFQAPILSCSFVPPQYDCLTTNSTVTGAIPNALSYSNYWGSVGMPYVPFVCTPVKETSTEGRRDYEFVIPDLSFFKFVGSPQKFDTTSSNYQLATADCGTLMLKFINTSNVGSKNKLEFFVGLTDESRFGFHTIAPLTTLYKKDKAMYLGTLQSAGAAPDPNLNKFIYFGGWL